jgi:aryl-alcohol dehydrogenase-like predicted oxidoreductase
MYASYKKPDLVLLGEASAQQLQENLYGAEVTPAAEVLEKIEAVHRLNPNPAP